MAPDRLPIAELDRTLSYLLSDRQAAAFRSLPAFDQTHLLAVYTHLRQAGVADDDLLIAGLLHDIGKVDETGHVRLADRVARVLLRQLAPRVLDRLAASPGRRGLHGLHLCVHHSRLGAERAKVLGCSARTVWLIARHEDHDPAGDVDLIALQAADRV